MLPMIYWDITGVLKKPQFCETRQYTVHIDAKEKEAPNGGDSSLAQWCEQSHEPTMHSGFMYPLVMTNIAMENHHF